MVSALRRVAKPLAYGLAAAVAPALLHLPRGPRLLVLTYHRVLPEGHPARAYEEPAMVLSPARLALHLQLLSQHMPFMHMEDWLDQRDGGAALPRLACAVTFDDGWADNHDHAFPVLQQWQVPATIYLATARIGGTVGFWPTRLSRLLCSAWERGEGDLRVSLATQLPAVVWPARVAAPQRREVLHQLIDGLKQHYIDAQIDDALQAAVGREGLAEVPDLLDWQQVQRMADSGLVRFGSHTRNHRRLRADLPAAVLQDEVQGSAQDIRQHLGRAPAGFCYPNGDLCAVARDCVTAHYRYAALNDLGINARATDPYSLLRVSFHDASGADVQRVLGRIAGACLGVGA